MKPLDILQDLLRIDTRNPPGNELAAVTSIEALCREVGLDYETHTFDGNRSSIIVRLAPACEERLVILGHLDVVAADSAGWTHGPFDAVVDDGYLYGRGALDMKYFVAVALSILVSMKPQEAHLTRGITCVFTADEENGSTYGLPKLLEIESIRRELTGRTVLNEGGGFAYEHDGVWYSMVETGQKSVCRLQVTVPEIPETNPYFPTLDHEQLLARAIRAVQAVELPSAVPETAVNLLTRFSQGSEATNPHEQLAHVKAGGDDFLYRLLSAMTHSMITPTIIRGGSRNPELARGVKASVVFDCRLLPEIGETEFTEAVRTALDGMPVELSVLSFSRGYETSFSNPIIRDAEAALKRHDPRIRACIPFLTPGANDGKYLRPLGCDVLGFAPLATSQPFKDIMPLIHGVNERISLESLAFCTDVMSDICRNYVHGSNYDDQS